MSAATPATVTLTIDGRPATAPAGATILDAAAAAGVKIPHLCKHEWIHRLASCRICVVKVAGVDGLVAACATPAAEGMTVTTDDDELRQMRRRQLQFVLLNHPLDCPVCDKGGECKLQDLTYALGVTEVPFRARLEGNRIDALSPLIERNDERCVRCGRCVAVCEEVQGVGAYRFAGRGYQTRIETEDGGPLHCEFCGQCVAICPVGALLSKQFKHKARVWELQRTTTACGYCGAVCQLDLATRRGKIFRAESDRRTSINDGKLCIRGRFGWDIVHDERRAATPLIRRAGRLVPVSWDEALDVVADGLRAARAADPGRVAAAAGARLPLEDLYALTRLCGAENTAVVGQDGAAAAFQVVRDRLGQFGSTAAFADLRTADALLLLGSDLAAEMPVPHLAALAAAREGDARLVVAHPTPTKLADFATASLRYRPGAADAVALLLLREVIAQNGCRLDFLAARTDGWAAFQSALERLDLAELREAAGLTTAAVQAAAAALAPARRPVVVLGPQAIAGPNARAATEAVVALLLALGAPEHSLLFSLDRGNLAGALRIGAGAAYGKIVDAGLAGRLDALLLVGGDPLVHAPRAEKLRQAMEIARLVVACDAFVGETAKKAHVFLPTTTFAERGGTCLSAENRLVALRPAVAPHADAWPEWRIFVELAKRLGVAPPGETLAELRKAVGTAIPELDAPAGALLPGRRPAADMKYRFGELPAVGAPARGELLLVVGPIFQHNGALSSWSKAIGEVAPSPAVELHPTDAARCGLRAGDVARVAAGGVELTAPIRLNERLTPGVAFAPPHFAAFPAGRLLGDAPFVAVHVEKQNQ